MGSQLFVTSDMHFGHKAMTAERPEKNWRKFDSVAEHDETIILNWNAVVRPSDTVYVLGDVAIDWRHGLDCISACNGTKILIPGNHDHVWSGNRDWTKYVPEYMKYFTAISPFVRRKWHGANYLMSHFPYDGDHTPKGDRYSQFRLRDEGLPLLCGHVHDAWAESFSEATGALQLNVGVDKNEFRPVALEHLMNQPLEAMQ